MKTKIFTLLLLVLSMVNLRAQETESADSTQNFTLSCDLVTNYIWRGLVNSDAPNIQPYLAYTTKSENFTLGAFGSYSLADYYSEIDLFASLSIGMFTFEVWDYFAMGQESNNHYFNFDKNLTAHQFEGICIFNGPESFPLQLTVGTIFYGADKDTVSGDNYYSTYVELAYPFKWKKNNLSLFIGGTPKEGMYASDLAINNIGIKNEREIRINDHFSLPVSGSLIFNPHQESVFLVFAITLGAND